MRSSYLLIALATVVACQAETPRRPPTPPSEDAQSDSEGSGQVPDAAAAVRLAEAAWRPIFGEEIETQRPFTARLEDSVWVVKGTLPPGRIGGVAMARVARRDGRILSVNHGQ